VAAGFSGQAFSPHNHNFGTVADMFTVAPMANNAEDLEVLLKALWGEIPRHIACPSDISNTTTTATDSDGDDITPMDLQDYRVGIWVDEPTAAGGRFSVDGQISSVVDMVAAKLDDAGATVTLTTRPTDQDAAAIHELYTELLSATFAGVLSDLEVSDLLSSFIIPATVLLCVGGRRSTLCRTSHTFTSLGGCEC
jgi:Asp-tRNA(Asn)/Glu-tRNA(Gln) amidotransferase A subunit family amidase